MLKIILIVLLFNKGDGNLEFTGIKGFPNRQTCEEFFSQTGPAPEGYRVAHRCIPIEQLDTTETTL